MQTTYHLNANELTPDFVQSVKANRAHLLRLMDEVERGENLVSVPLEVIS